VKHRRNLPAGGRSIRTLKVGEAMRHALAEVLTRQVVHDELLGRYMVSVSEVRVSPDLRHATAFVLPIGATAVEQQGVLRALARHAPQFRAEVARRINTRYATEIHFELDESFAEGARIDSLLRTPQVARDLAGDEQDGGEQADSE